MRIVAEFVIGSLFLAAIVACTLISIPWMIVGLGAAFLDGSYAYDHYVDRSPVNRLMRWEEGRNG